MMGTQLPVVLLAALVFCSGCVLKERYRYVQDQPTCFAPQPDPVPGVPGENRPFASVDCRSARYTTGFVEFNQQGELIDRAQAEKALKLIAHQKARARNGKIIAFVYVHGWKNNGNQAAPGGKAKDVERFSTALSELGFRAAQASSTDPVPVVGIYVGWKGKSLMGPGMITWLSYWGRRNTANRIGRDALTTLLNDVIKITVPTATDQSRVMLVGHSFGARVLERAIENGVTLYDPEALRRTGEPLRPRVDLVLYVNAANDSRQSMARVQTLQKDPITVRHPDYEPAACASGTAQNPICKEYPLIVAVTSRGDSATRRVQPIANTVNFDRQGVNFPPLPIEQHAFLDGVPTTRRVRGTAAANLPFLQSHVVTETVCPAGGVPIACNATDPACAFAFQGRGECTACFTVSKRQEAQGRKPYNETAFWIMDVDARVIRDHGDIWNQSTLSMIGAMMAPRGFFEPGTGRMQIRAR